jgi:hypothetical protein
MESKIKKILVKIDELNDALKKEHQRIAEKYGYLVQKRKVVFLDKFRRRNKNFRMPAWKYVFPKSIKHLISLPFIYSMLIPAVILDLFISVYHFVAFPLYGIPRVKRSEYIIFDRRFLDYLNVVQKVHCIYCSYVNGLFAYSLEIAARTERYWCPIKAASKPRFYHNWYGDFADYGNPEDWVCKFNDHKAFEVVDKKK